MRGGGASKTVLRVMAMRIRAKKEGGVMIRDKGAIKEQNVPGRERAEIWETEEDREEKSGEERERTADGYIGGRCSNAGSEVMVEVH